jgi:hypothetical protein
MLVQAIYSALLLSIIAAAGLVKGVDSAWELAAITAALAFFAEQIRAIYDGLPPRFWFYVGNFLAVTSWFTGAAAGLSLLIAR